MGHTSGEAGHVQPVERSHEGQGEVSHWSLVFPALTSRNSGKASDSEPGAGIDQPEVRKDGWICGREMQGYWPLAFSKQP